MQQKRYVRETKRPIRDRLMEHRRAAKNRDAENPWESHFLKDHESTPVPTIQAEIISRTKDQVDRKITEAVYITEISPELTQTVGGNSIRGQSQSQASMHTSPWITTH